MAINHPSQVPRPLLPRIASEWKLLFRPEKTGCFINDHCVVKGFDGKWHLYGITSHHKEANPNHERWFAHGVGESLWSEQPMQETAPVCDEGQRSWAPAVILHGPLAYMIYGPAPTRMVISRDMNHWRRAEINLHNTPLEACNRDHAILKIEDGTWLMYATGVAPDGTGAISVFASHDLINWSFVRYALRTCGKGGLNPDWGATESPFVAHLDGWYYLSTTYTDSISDTYHQTLIFRSLNPFDFGTYDADKPEESVVQTFKAHAPEYIYCDREKSWFITTCGWPGRGTPHEGGVSIARLAWDPAQGLL
jgi:beta-fructofuranosidase